MPLHLIKLSVGSESVQSLVEWQQKVSFKHKSGVTAFIHGTTQAPKRAEELLAGGSIYWIIKGAIVCRNPIIAIDLNDGKSGRARCSLVCGMPLVAVVPKKHRIFQGWRYFDAAAAPRDLPKGKAEKGTIPADLAGELSDMGLL